MFKIEKIEYRPAKKGEWIWNTGLDKPDKASYNYESEYTNIVLIGYEPEKFVPEENEQYYTPAPTILEQCSAITWLRWDVDIYRLKNNLCYPYTDEGKRQAIEHAKKMLEVTL